MMKKDFWSDILIFLDDPKRRKAGFEEIRKGVGGSPRSINHHLKKLYEEELIKKEWGRKGRYYLTDAGEANAAHERDLRGIVETAKSLPNDKLKKLNEELKKAKDETSYLKAVLTALGHAEINPKEFVELLKNLHSWLQREDVQREMRKAGLTKFRLKIPGQGDVIWDLDELEKKEG